MAKVTARYTKDREGNWKTVPADYEHPIMCKVCDRGTLVRKKQFRMSGPVVVIGFILLIPSVLGIFVSGLILLGVIFTAGSESDSARNEAMESMRNHSIPEPIISAVLAGNDQEAEKLMDEWPQEPIEIGGRIIKTVGLPEVQRSWVRSAQKKIRGASVESGIGAIIGSGSAVAIGIACFVGGLLGWLLVMRKHVLQCSVCGAVINAS
jgi:hypothetical protein